VTNGIQWGKSEIRVLEGGRVHTILFFFLLKNDRYDCNKGEERNPMEYVSNNGANRIHTFVFIPAELYSDLKNTAVMKCPNA
jgi:hypothetical protein